MLKAQIYVWSQSLFRMHEMVLVNKFGRLNFCWTNAKVRTNSGCEQILQIFKDFTYIKDTFFASRALYHYYAMTASWQIREYLMGIIVGNISSSESPLVRSFTAKEMPFIAGSLFTRIKPVYPNQFTRIIYKNAPRTK